MQRNTSSGALMATSLVGCPNPWCPRCERPSERDSVWQRQAPIILSMMTAQEDLILCLLAELHGPPALSCSCRITTAATHALADGGGERNSAWVTAELQSASYRLRPFPVRGIPCDRMNWAYSLGERARAQLQSVPDGSLPHLSVSPPHQEPRYCARMASILSIHH